MGFSDQIKDALEEEIEVDFSGAGEQKDFSPVPAGRYTFVVESCEPGVSGSGNAKVTFKLKIAEGSTGAGRVFFKHCPTSGEASGILRDILVAIDLPIANGFKPKSTVGKKLSMEVRMQKGSDVYQEVVYPRAV